MNQHSIDKNNHYSRKRNSYEVTKTSFSLKNAKKSLPQVCIDLNEQQKKNRLALQQRINKAKESQIEVSYFDDKRKGLKAAKKKEPLNLKISGNTELIRPQNENKNVLNEYRDEIELLKLDNERLRQENQKLKKNDQYYIKRFKEFRQENYIESKELKAYVEELQAKVDKYSAKIKKLYEELILQKQRGVESRQKKASWTSSTIREEPGPGYGQIRGQIYSYRAQGSHSRDHRQRFTSPSSPQMEKIHLTEGIDKLLRYEMKGQEAYYKASEGQYGTLHSDLQ